MKKEIEKIIIIKEGNYYTLYIDETQLGCGSFEDMTEELPDYIKMYLNDDYEMR